MYFNAHKWAPTLTPKYIPSRNNFPTTSGSHRSSLTDRSSSDPTLGFFSWSVPNRPVQIDQVFGLFSRSGPSWAYSLNTPRQAQLEVNSLCQHLADFSSGPFGFFNLLDRAPRPVRFCVPRLRWSFAFRALWFREEPLRSVCLLFKPSLASSL